MPLQATSGAASYDAFGGGVPAVPNYIEDVFSTWLYTGNVTPLAITNGIDLSTKGGLIWTKERNNTASHLLIDSQRGLSGGFLRSNTTDAADTSRVSESISSFNTDGYSLHAPDTLWDRGSYNYVSWTFRKQPKFFDVVTYTGNGVNGRAISHNLGSTPGFIVVKCTSAASQWTCWHRAYNSGNGYGYLNDTTSWFNTGADVWGNGTTYTAPTSTTFTVNAASGLVNDSSATYVAYLFAHDAGGFGLTGTDNVISCGSYAGTGSVPNDITLGFEPQWLLVKNTTSSGQEWGMFDNMRGLVTGTDGDAQLFANASSAENVSAYFRATATGFACEDASTRYNASGNTYIYIAIRRGPMKVPTSGTSVFYPNAISQAETIDSTNVPFPPDLVNTFSRNGTDRSVGQMQFVDRLRSLGTPNNSLSGNGGPALLSASTAAEGGSPSYVQLKADSQNITRSSGWNSATYGNWIYYFFRRAPSFFDEVCYTGTGVARTISHNLGAAPELMIVKQRSAARNWPVYTASTATNEYLILNGGDLPTTATTVWNNTAPTASVFSVGTSALTNASAGTYVAYLFSSCAGVSKVGSYTGTGALQTINCGFTSGARFVLIKLISSGTSGSGDWYVWDSARGISSGNDPYLLLNSTSAETTGTNYVDTDTTGFKVTAAGATDINASGDVYLFLAIA